MAVAIDFGDFPGVNMQDPAGLGAAIFTDFSTFNFTTGQFVAPTLDIPNHANPASQTAFVRAYSNNWSFQPNGEPVDGTIIHGLEVWVPDVSGDGQLDYRIVIDGISVSWQSFEAALLGKNLSALYAGQALEILGTAT